MRAIWRLVMIALLAAACQTPPPSIGGPCTTGTGAGPPGTITITGSAFDCQGGICVQIGGATSGTCSASCTSDADCRDVTPGAGAPCVSGFTCAVATSVGELACQKLCLCRDSASLWQSAAAACGGPQAH
jgi:hypothetical protein